MDAEKKRTDLLERVTYARDILGDKSSQALEQLSARLEDFELNPCPQENGKVEDSLRMYEQQLVALEERLESRLTAMDKVRIVRHPQRICLKDILENVYDNYVEIGGKGELNIDPGMLIARAYITRRVGSKLLNQPVMVVGQEKGHGEEFRNGGSIKPWGNAKALKYMKVAARENIPIHTFVFTPGSYPVEDPPGAAQQIAENIYEMAGLDVPVVTVFSEGGSGGAEAIAMCDKRLMLSHGYYSVISPEGAAAIEGRIKTGERASAEMIEKCALHQQITAQDNLKNGYIDKVIHEPPLGARPEHFDFYKKLRTELITATDEVALSVRGMRFLRGLAMRARRKKLPVDVEHIIVRWELTAGARLRLIAKRHKKFQRMAQHAYKDKRSLLEKLNAAQVGVVISAESAIRFKLLKSIENKVSRFIEEVTDEIHVITSRFSKFFKNTMMKVGISEQKDKKIVKELTGLSNPEDAHMKFENGLDYISPQAEQDKEVTCPRARKRNCQDVWARDLFGDFAGVCPSCGHHFPMEYQWYLANVFDRGSIREFNRSIAAGNPTNFPNFDERVDAAKKKTGLQSGCMTFNASLEGIHLTCATFIATFRGGSVGAAEGEKFIRAIDLARKKHQPFLAYVHGTAGIRIQEGVNGLIQMPRCTMAVRRYIEAGGLYIVLYDTNSYAGPVASFLGCSPYQYAVRSARVGFAGPKVIKETTGLDIPPNYHSAHSALSRSHIQDIWDRREIRNNLHRAFKAMGGRNLYYR